MKSKVRRKRAFAIGLGVVCAILLLAALGAFIFSREEPRVVITPQQQESTPYHDGIGLVETFSSEANIPFRFVGKTIYDKPLYGRREYISSVEKFDNVLSCLSEESRVLEKPSLGDFDWTQIDSDEDAAVCLFRVATSYATMDDMENWMRSQGLRVGRRLVRYVDAIDGLETGLNAFWPIKERGPLYQANMLHGRWNSRTAWGQGVTITYREGLGVYWTGVSITRK
jgi:hypothetical protein